MASVVEPVSGYAQGVIQRLWSAPLSLLDLSKLDDTRRVRVLAKQDSLRHHCGCIAGSLFALGMLTLYAWNPHPVQPLWRTVAAGASWVIGAAVAGKFLSLVSVRVGLLAQAILLRWCDSGDGRQS